MSQKATRKATHKPKDNTGHMGSLGQQNAPEAISTAAGGKEDSTTENVIVPGMFSGYSKRFNPRVFEGNENNGINPGYRCKMEELLKFNKLDALPDAQIVGRKVYQGERGAYLFAFGPLARLLATPEELEGCVFLVIVRWLPVDYIDTVETILDAEGYSVSRA